MKKQFYFYLFGIGVALFAFVFLLSTNLIGYSVKEKCKIAEEKYGGDCVEALIEYLDDEKNGFHSRNSAIWTLGQLGDERALPILQKYFTNNIPKKEPFDKTISQYELKKAIGYFEGGLNITKFFWQFN